MRIQFHKSDKGLGNEDWYYLCKDENGHAFVQHEWSHRAGDGFQEGVEDISIHQFLANAGTRQDKLLDLIGSFVPNDDT